MRLTGLFAALAGAGLVLFGEPAACLLFDDAAAGTYVRLLGWIAPFMYFESMVDGILKGLGEQLATFRYTVLDSALRIFLIVLLVPQYGLTGFLGVMVCSNLLTCMLNTRRMLRRTGMRAAWLAWFAGPAALALLGAALTLAVRQIVADSAAGWLAQGFVFLAGAGGPAALLLSKNRELVQARRRA